MITRPVYKLLVVLLATPLFVSVVFLWSITGNRLKTYYLGLESGFLFETVMPLPAPVESALAALGLSELDRAREFDIITIRCASKNCYATPRAIATGIAHQHTRIRMRPSKLYAILNEQVFDRHPFRWLNVLLALSSIAWLALFVYAAIRDCRRQRQLLGDGVRIAGRRAVPAAAFAGLRARFLAKRNVNIAVAEPSQEDAPLSYD